jgi:hypothetical protein
MLTSYFLCKGFNEEVRAAHQEAFWMLSHLIEEVLPREYYTTMISLTADINIFLLFLNIKRPKVFKHLQNCNFQLPMVLVELFITVFTTNQTYMTDIIMDLILLDGSTVFFRVFLVFFSYFEKELLKLTEFCNWPVTHR